MLCLFLLISTLEVVGIGLIGPFIALATNPTSIHQSFWLSMIYGRLQLSSDYQFLLITGLLVVILFYLKAFLNFNSQKQIFEFGFGQQAELATRLMKVYLMVPYTFHLNRNSATLIQNISNETERFATGLLIPLLTTISNIIVTLALVALLVATNALAVIIVAGVILAAFLIVYSLKDRLKSWGQNASEARAEMIRAINHGLGGLKETKVIGCETYFEVQLQEQAEKFSKNIALAVGFSNLPRFMIEAFLITFLILFTVLFIKFNQQDSQQLSAVLGIFALASIRLLPAISNVVSSVSGIRYSLFSLDQIYFDLKEQEVINQKENPHVCQAFQSSLTKVGTGISFSNHIILDNLIYCYPNATKNALKGISLTIRKGKSIGLIGKSGSGKTTLIDVLLGLLVPQVGDITVDGVSVYTDLRSWQNMIGYVPQSIFLIDDTLKRNIAFGVPDHFVDQERLLMAVEAAQLSELLEQLPQGLETPVGERGVLLSGGQRQRVGIARALYHEREILVFDEATAALDNETEALVTESIKSLSGKKTMIIIAHRLSTIEHCDRIYALEKGEIVKSGSYQEVVESVRSPR